MEPDADPPAADAPPQALSLLNALVAWSDPRRVQAVRDAELSYSTVELSVRCRPQLAEDVPRPRPTGQSWMAGSARFATLDAAWEALERDFRTRIERGELYLEGVLSTDDPGQQPESIPNAWAAELQFDFTRNRILKGKRRYLAIAVSRQPSPWHAIESVSDGRNPRPSMPITPTSVRELTDGEVLLLVEEYHRRVVEDPATNLSALAKVSFLPILDRKMRHRAATGEIAPSLKAESSELETWIKQKAPSHQTPTASTIAKQLAPTYRALRPTSNADI